MRSTILILILLFPLLFIQPAVAEDVQEWYIKAENALTVGDYPTAVACYTNALNIDRNYAPAYAGRAAAFNMMGKYTEAIASADSALAIKSMDPVALNARALGLFKLGRYEEAVAAYDKLFIVVQNSKEAYCNQAYAYLKLNRTEPAVAASDRCTLLDPQNLEAWNNKGLALMQGGDYNGALAAFNRATTISVKNATVWNNKGVALMALGRPVDALESFKKALGIDPNYAVAKANREKATGAQQSFNISGTIVPEVTISRIGTYYTTAVPSIQPPAEITQVPETSNAVPAGTTKPVTKKTTYAPVSPLTVLGAVAAGMGMVAVMRRERG